MYILFLFLIGSFLGWLWENLILGVGNSCGDTFYTVFLKICLPFLNIYGFGLIILWFIYNKFYKKIDYTKLIVLSTILISSFECLVGILSNNVNHKKTWNYPSSNLCFGFISIQSILTWLIFITIIFSIFNKLNI